MTPLTDAIVMNELRKTGAIHWRDLALRLGRSPHGGAFDRRLTAMAARGLIKRDRRTGFVTLVEALV